MNLESVSSESLNLKEYLQKTTSVKCPFIKNEPSDDFTEVPSPIIDIEMKNIDELQIITTNSCDTVNDQQVEVNVKIESVTTGTNNLIDSKLALNKPNPATNNNKLRPNETTFTLQTLASTSQMNTCTFCGSYLIDYELEDSDEADNENKENISQTEQSQPLQMVQFCSDFCKSSYKKLLIIRKNKIEAKIKEKEDAENAKDLKLLSESQKELEVKKVIKWSSNLTSFSPSKLKEKRTSSSSLLSKTFEILKPTHCSDKRVCIFCQGYGDQDATGPSRLLVVDVDKWCHLNCALWSDEVYETMNGALVNVDLAFRKSINIECCYCHQKGASLKCFSNKCTSNYHFMCAVKDKCAFNQDKVNNILCLPGSLCEKSSDKHLDSVNFIHSLLILQFSSHF